MRKYCDEEGNKNVNTGYKKSTNKSTQAKTEAKPRTSVENRTNIGKIN